MSANREFGTAAARKRVNTPNEPIERNQLVFQEFVGAIVELIPIKRTFNTRRSSMAESIGPSAKS
jgi:hypothetical protein